jgi:hypothetical protein
LVDSALREPHIALRVAAPSIKFIISHWLGTTIFVVLAFFGAVALDFFEHWCRRNGVSEWLCSGMAYFGMFLFSLDVILAAFLVVTFVFGVMVEMCKKPRRKKNERR